jgi:hypothetical protein
VSALKDVDGFHPANLGALTKLGEDYRKRFRATAQSPPPLPTTEPPSDSEVRAARCAAAARAARGDGAAAAGVAALRPLGRGDLAASSLAALVEGEYPPLSLEDLGINAPCTALGYTLAHNKG